MKLLLRGLIYMLYALPHPPPHTHPYRVEKPAQAGNTKGGGLSTVDLLIKVACFVKDVNNIFNIKRS
jgi:hypothetical protein